MDASQRLVEIVKAKGPLLPVTVAQELQISLLIASAMLSEQVARGNIRVTSVKIGGSPLYYHPDQIEKLQNFADKLHEKEKKSYDLLKSRGILRDKDQEPIVRATLREIKDYAKAIEVSINDQKELFWKWYLLSNPEVQKLLEEQFKKAPQKVPGAKSEEKNEKPLTEFPKQDQSKQSSPKKQDSNDFFKQVYEYFKHQGITIITEKNITKNKEMDFLLKGNSVFGSIIFYCKAKNKKRINENDLSNAFVQGKVQNLPILFISAGKLTKKAEEICKGELKYIKIKMIDDGS